MQTTTSTPTATQPKLLHPGQRVCVTFDQTPISQYGTFIEYKDNLATVLMDDGEMLQLHPYKLTPSNHPTPEVRIEALEQRVVELERLLKAANQRLSREQDYAEFLESKYCNEEGN